MRRTLHTRVTCIPASDDALCQERRGRPRVLVCGLHNPRSMTKQINTNPIGRAIVTYSRSFYALAAIRNLGRHGVDVIAGDELALTPGALSRFCAQSFRYPDPHAEPEAFLDALEEAIHRYYPGEGVPYVLLPMHQESFLIARHRRRFEGLIHVPLPAYHQLEATRNSRRLMLLAQELGISTPPTYMPYNLQSLKHVAEEIALPAFVKMPESTGGLGVHKVETADELMAVYQDLLDTFEPEGDQQPFVQSASPGEDYCVCALFAHGEPRAIMTYHNVATYPPDSGPGAIREAVKAEPLERIALDLLRHLKWHGMAQLDFRWDPSAADSAALLEVNPRFYGGLFQSIVSGIEFPWLLFQLAVQGDIAPVNGPLADPSKDPLHFDIQTEVPLRGLLAMISEAVPANEIAHVLHEQWQEAEHALATDGLRSAYRRLSTGLMQSLSDDMRSRLDRVRALWKQNRVSELVDWNDPLPLLGLLYPVEAFARHHSISQKTMVGAA